MGLFGLFGKKDYYSEGYGDGQQYQEEYPDLGKIETSLAHVQVQLNALNEELGMDENEVLEYEEGFYVGYVNEPYEPPEPSGFSLRRLFGL